MITSAFMSSYASPPTSKHGAKTWLLSIIKAFSRVCQKGVFSYLLWLATIKGVKKDQNISIHTPSFSNCLNLIL